MNQKLSRYCRPLPCVWWQFDRQIPVDHCPSCHRRLEDATMRAWLSAVLSRDLEMMMFNAQEPAGERWACYLMNSRTAQSRTILVVTRESTIAASRYILRATAVVLYPLSMD